MMETIDINLVGFLVGKYSCHDFLSCLDDHLSD